MGTAFVALYVAEWADSEDQELDDATLEIGRIVFRSVVEVMERERPRDQKWKGELDASYGIKYLYVGGAHPDSGFDLGPAFLRAVRYLREHGPPEYYPEKDMDLLYRQLDELEETYLELRPQRDV